MLDTAMVLVAFMDSKASPASRPHLWVLGIMTTATIMKMRITMTMITLGTTSSLGL